MKTTFAAVVLSLLLASQAVCQTANPLKAEASAKPKVAVLNIYRITNSGINYERLRLLSLDKPTIDALKKIETEIQDVQMQITDVEDEVKLGDLGRRLEFLSRKSSLLKQRAMNSNSGGQDMQAAVRNFVIENFKDKYALILQQQDQGGNVDRILWKGDVEVVDITDEAREKFMEYLDQLGGGTATRHYRPMPRRTVYPEKKAVDVPMKAVIVAAPKDIAPLPDVARPQLPADVSKPQPAVPPAGKATPQPKVE